MAPTKKAAAKSSAAKAAPKVAAKPAPATQAAPITPVEKKPLADIAPAAGVAVAAAGMVLASTTKTAEALGPAWCARFLGSNSLDDLTPDFGARVKAMISALEAGGATVTIAATYRPRERAYLMHYCCMIAQGGQDPAAVPAMDGVAIDWTAGGNRARAKALAAQMVAGYRIKFPAALVSNHTERRAVDMHINIPARPDKPTTFKDAAGKTWTFGAGDAASLYKFGATFGVIKLVKDEPHWSDDGH